MKIRTGINFCLLISLFLTVSLLPVKPASIEITYLDSPVKYRGPDDLTWTELDRSDTSLPGEGDLLVGEGGAVGLRDGDTSTIRLNEKTGISLIEGELGDTVRVNHGSTHFDVKDDLPDDSNYRIRTTNASLGIRGTEFGVSYERDVRSEVFVEDGVVGFSSNDDRNILDKGSYGRTSQSASGGGGSISVGDSVPSRFRLTWDHWSTERKIRTVRNRLDQLRNRSRSLEKRIESGNVSDTSTAQSQLSDIRDRIDSLESTRDDLSDRYNRLQSRYESFRRELERKRRDFIRRRRQALDRFRRRRMEAMREMQEDRRRGIERMRRRREKSMSP